jgi:hypothetical protein
MVTRVIEVIAKSQRSALPYQAIDAAARQILRMAPGFVEQITLAAEGQPRLVILVSLWRSERAAGRYDQEVYPQICAALAASTLEDLTVL